VTTFHALGPGESSIFARLFSKRKSQRQNPAVIVLMEFLHGNLHAGADAEAKPFRDWK
jgi:hypothetical protein